MGHRRCGLGGTPFHLDSLAGINDEGKNAACQVGEGKISAQNQRGRV